MTAIAPHRFSFAAHGTRQMEHLESLGYLPLAFRPLKGAPFQIETRGVFGKSVNIWHTLSRHGFVTLPRNETGPISIRFVTSGSIIRRNRRAAHVARPDRAMVLNFNDMQEEEASSGFESVACAIDLAAAARALEALEGPGTRMPNFEPVVDIVGTPLVAFARSVGVLTALLKVERDENDLTFPLVEEILIYQFLSAWPRREGAAVAARPLHSRQLRAALDVIEADLSRRLTLADIAAAAGVSVRSLQSAFRTELGLTPMEYILNARLERVHHDLSSWPEGQAGVADIARRWGFVHMSDFARRYRERFGCAPTETRRGSGQ